jgi:hypothetical protein
MTRSSVLLAIAGLPVLATSALAQTPSFTSDSTISMPLSWSEVNGNSNGVLEPGESAAIVLDVSFTNQFSMARFSPPIGTFTSGTILGFGAGVLDVAGAGGTEGAFVLGNNPLPQTNNGTAGYGVRNWWRIVGSASAGSVNGTGTGITYVQFGQFPQLPDLYQTTNPIPRMYAFLWTPTSYAVRTVTFALVGHEPPMTGAVLLGFDSFLVSVFVDPAHLSLGSVSIPIAPAPPAAAAIALGLVPRRRRRGASS